MSSSHSMLDPITSDAGNALEAAIAAGTAAVERAAAALETVAFWGAVVLPFLYLPVLVNGAPVLPDPVVLVALLAANVVALVVGHDHRREARE